VETFHSQLTTERDEIHTTSADGETQCESEHRDANLNTRGRGS